MLSVADNLAVWGGKFLKRVKGVFRFCLLEYAYDGIDYKYGQDDNGIGNALAVHVSGNARYDGCHQQHYNHKTLELRNELLPQCGVFFLGKFIKAFAL